MIKCIGCEEFKSKEEFHGDSRRPNGVQSRCRICVNVRRLEKYKANPENVRIVNRKATKKYKIVNKEKYNLASSKYREENREAYNKRISNWTKRNPGKNAAKSAKYRSVKLQATIQYDIYKDLIEQIYINCPEGYHVDHIIPLQGKDVRGLHVPWNLQYLPAKINQKKGNRT